MNLDQIKSDLEQTAVEDLDAGFKMFIKVLPDSSLKRNQLILLEGQYHDARRRETDQTVTMEEANVARTRVRKAFLEMASGLQETDFTAQGSGTRSLPAAIPKFTVIYDLADQAYCTKLNRHLNLLHKILKKIRVYNVHEDVEGDAVAEARTALEDTDYILVLITVNFFNAVEWFEIVYNAIGAGKRVIPVLISRAEIDEETGLTRLRSLPTLGRWVSDFKNEDEAYTDIVGSLKKLLPAKT